MERSNHFAMKTKYGAMAATTIPFMILAGAYLAFVYINGGGWKKRDEKSRVRKRSVTMGVLHGGKFALQRLVDYQEARADGHKLKSIECQLRLHFQQENPDFLNLQRIVAKMEMSGNEDKAVKLLGDEKRKAQTQNRMHEAYEIEMLLVEMLIYKGEFRKAFGCNCLREEQISDARRPLYKAVIYLAIESPKHERAKESWEKFRKIREDFNDPPCLKESIEECMGGDEFHKLATNFDEFKKVVEMLKDDINKTHAKRKKKNIDWNRNPTTLRIN